ncbi:DUF6148 family protein [Clostridium magnum]|uniref:Uncharacterized protein n=1 Tax=Clostridium magnum DSM 2767 TaxID=1121326 RepID=A0A162QM79_9CLOT|nr:DUF6148 family protein [Clostridium magnum]KZL88704.1 hypothetical protein CLMAG_59930 [Clostridium magnum DSM 2767]SHJ44477.1 hypothetical protein SAMN02745944_05977 [Clostridium magnum DSM 2767]
MAAWTIQQARDHLQAWMEAELKVTAGQSYSIGTRQLTRADLGQINEKIKFWANEVEKLEARQQHRGTNRVYRVVPRDL